MIEKVEGIILLERNYSDSSKILEIITKEHGKISVLAKGARKIKSKLHAGTNKFIHGFFHIYYKEDKLSTLIEVDIISSLPNVRKDIYKSSYVAYITDLLKQTIKEECNEGLFDLYLSVINKIEEGYDEAVLANIFELRILEILGVALVLDECAICGSTTHISTVSVDKGGYVCHNCLENDRIYSEKTIKILRMFNYIDIDKITKLEISNEVKKEINEFLNEYYDQYTGIYLKTKDFLKNLQKIA